MSKRKPWTLAVGAGLICCLWGLAGCDGSTSAPEPEIRPVRTQKIHYQSLADLPSLVGDIRPHYESDLGFKISGRVLVRSVQLGTIVHKGQVLATLDDQDQRNQLRASSADLASAQATLDQAAAEERRQIALHQDGWATQAKLESARQARQTAEAAAAAAAAKLRLAKDQLDYATLRAPEDGAVTQLGAEAGQVVSAGQLVARLARLDRKDAVVSVAESAIGAVPLNSKADVSLLDFPAVKTRGTVAEISPAADPVTRTYTVKVALPDGIPDMRLGMSAVVRFASPERRLAELPGAALFQQDGKPAIWVVEPERLTVSLVPVTLYQMDDERLLVEGGPAEGARVVTAGIQFLRPGQKVRLAASEPAP
ncbi:efflux RND transporter periplasmic adaptor subunit [Telmatospirillum siberiense]|uniref:Efflux RND transporter periplasmic adaptor subunit n=1 Tax=Telmatospirillum siberiense TaxID=382514 RepID=A0A2N3PWC9_9PROT|nr:efflux RND transporter periplasmic adaptor subunit [Telmatospirillum siberiense]PKU24685.1 efflux RND transporter periplasmic adaptor subunit [Telmatospirillum siberiense]